MEKQTEWVSARAVWKAVGGRRWGHSAQTDVIRQCAARKALSRAKSLSAQGRHLTDYALPEAFWRLPPKSQDWELGAFTTVIEGAEWNAIGVEFQRSQLEALGISLEQPEKPMAADTMKRRGAGGRSLSKHWPTFVAELALWIEEANNDPKLFTPAKLIDKLNDRLAAKGIEQMPPSTAEETIRAVLVALQGSGA